MVILTFLAFGVAGVLTSYLLSKWIRLLRETNSRWSEVELKPLERNLMGYFGRFAHLWHGYELHDVEKVKSDEFGKCPK